MSSMRSSLGANFRLASRKFPWAHHLEQFRKSHARQRLPGTLQDGLRSFKSRERLEHALHLTWARCRLPYPARDAAEYGVLENSTLTERGLLPPLEPNRIDLGQVDAQREDVHVVVDLPDARDRAEGPLEL